MPRYLFLFIVPLLAGGASAQSTSTSAFLSRMTTETPLLLVEHCAKEHPDSAEELRTEYEVFKRKAAAAIERVSERMPQQMSTDEAAEAARLMTEVGSKQLEEVRKLAPEVYCPWLIQSLRSTTAESFAARVQAAYERYTTLAASRKPSGGAQ